MPTRTTVSPWAFPKWFTRFGRFPQGKIHRTFLFLIHGNPCTGFHVFWITAGKLSIIFKRFNGKIDITAFHMIGLILVNQHLDKFYNMSDMPSRLGFNGGTKHIECVHFIMEFINIFLCNRRTLFPGLIGFFNNFIIHIGKISDIFHGIAQLGKPAIDRIKHDNRTCMTDMTGIINGRPAHIHAHLIFYQGYKFFFFTMQCIINS